MKRVIRCVAALALLCGGAASASVWPEEYQGSGIGVRGGTWGIPDAVLKLFLDQYASVDGQTFGVEWRQYGADGPDGPFSVSYAFDYGRMDGTGSWLLKDDKPEEDLRVGKASVDVFAVTATFLWDFMSEWIPHPYIGFGLGLAYVDGRIPPGPNHDEGSYKGLAPAVHIPVGIRAQVTDFLSLSLDGRFFQGGFSLGGGVTYTW